MAAARPTAAAAMPALAAGLIFLGRLAGSGRQRRVLLAQARVRAKQSSPVAELAQLLVWAYIRLARRN